MERIDEGRLKMRVYIVYLDEARGRGSQEGAWGAEEI